MTLAVSKNGCWANGIYFKQDRSRGPWQRNVSRIYRIIKRMSTSVNLENQKNPIWVCLNLPIWESTYHVKSILSISLRMKRIEVSYLHETWYFNFHYHVFGGNKSKSNQNELPFGSPRKRPCILNLWSDLWRQKETNMFEYFFQYIFSPPQIQDPNIAKYPSLCRELELNFQS